MYVQKRYILPRLYVLDDDMPEDAQEIRNGEYNDDQLKYSVKLNNQ